MLFQSHPFNFIAPIINVTLRDAVQSIAYQNYGGRRFLRNVGTQLPHYMAPHSTNSLYSQGHGNIKSCIPITSEAYNYAISSLLDLRAVSATCSSIYSDYVLSAEWQTKLISNVYEMLRFTLLSLICDKNADPFTYHFSRCPQALLRYKRWCWSIRARNPQYTWVVQYLVCISQHLPETKQKPVLETWTMTLVANQVPDKAQTVCFSTGRDIIFVLARINEHMQGLNCYLEKIQLNWSKQVSVYGNAFFNLKEPANKFQNQFSFLGLLSKPFNVK
jgi:hypothetical protein